MPLNVNATEFTSSKYSTDHMFIAYRLNKPTKLQSLLYKMILQLTYKPLDQPYFIKKNTVSQICSLILVLSLICTVLVKYYTPVVT